MSTNLKISTIMLILLLNLLESLEEEKGKYIFKNGDFIIGLLFPVHHVPPIKQKKSHQSIECGTIREQYGVQRVEVTLQTVDKINNDSYLLPNLTLGLEIRDECWYAPVALQQSIELIRDAITPSTSYPNSCSNSPEAQLKLNAEFKGPLIGVVGPGASSVALQVQNLLQLFHIPQVGYSTTSKDLSDKSRFNYFQRVVPSDYYQAQVMLDIVRYHGWTYVSAVNTDENYGQSGIQAFRDLAEEADVCIAREDSVLSNAPAEVFDKVIMNLRQDVNARVVVCFCEGFTVRGLLMATRRLNMSNHFIFIGSDGWADRRDVTTNYEKEAWGGISIRIHSPYVYDFDPYYLSLKPSTNKRNPWFKELWETRFNCSLNYTNFNGNTNGNGHYNNSFGLSNRNYTLPSCTGNERLSKEYRQDPKLSFVIKAVYTFAYALHNLRQDICGEKYVGICEKLNPFNGSLFKNYLMNVSFSYDDDIVEFDDNGDPPGRYDIVNYQKLKNGTFDYVQVGIWNNRTLNWITNLQFGPHPFVKSVCSSPCPSGHYKNVQHGGKDKRCCWVCVKCPFGETLDESSDFESCQKCPLGSIPDNTQTVCVLLPIEYMQWFDTQAVVAIFFSTLGFITTSFAFIVFAKYSDTPVVKSSTKELSYTILVGMITSHASIFVILAKPTKVTCTLSRFIPGLSFAMIYAALLTKTNRIARILAGSKKRFPTRKPLFMSATAQILITCFLIGIEIFISIGMLMYQKANSTHTYYAMRTVLECNTTPEGVVVPLAFDFFLILLCTVYAVKTRNVPENFNEAKFIGFAMYTTCVIWIAFVPIYFGSDSKVITMSMCVTFSAMVTWIFLFVPKMYIILFRPEKNNRAFFTTSKNIRCHIGCRVSTAISEKSSINSWKDSSCSCKEIEKHAKDIPQKRTLSCQTGIELIQVLLNPRNLMDIYSPTRSPLPRITERDCCEADNCQMKKITIKLPNNVELLS
ncbi:hypothetical protein FQA39_LY07513 [Lamprigera yunnana]|nr:hypothetical protein FQA39_LY07513 [Lamprigera yunnana]